MADKVEIAKNAMGVLSGVFSQGSTYADVSNMIKVTGSLASAFTGVGAILVLVQGFLPDGKHAEILRGFADLSNKFDKVRDDIQQMKSEFKWDLTEVQYAGAVARIQSGMKHCLEIGKRSERYYRRYYQNKLKALCANEYCDTALNAILDGMIGNGIFESKSILDKFYDKTEGDRPRISALGTRLLQLVCGGMIVMSTYETMMHEEYGAQQVNNHFYPRLKEASDEIQLILNKCVDNFENNMRNDLNKKLDEGGSNRDLLGKIQGTMIKKYDWLEIFCLVYNDLQGLDKHKFAGHGVSSLHRNGKCGIVFYRNKGEAPRFSNRYNEAYNIVGDDWCGYFSYYGWHYAWKCYDTIAAQTAARGIGWTGLAVIIRYPDLWFGGTFSTETVYVVGSKHTAILLLQ